MLECQNLRMSECQNVRMSLDGDTLTFMVCDEIFCGLFGLESTIEGRSSDIQSWSVTLTYSSRNYHVMNTKISYLYVK